ncbi:MAG TPA: hypothetical protein VIM73_12630, partial [Polyangiaceae bacterium]
MGFVTGDRGEGGLVAGARTRGAEAPGAASTAIVAGGGGSSAAGAGTFSAEGAGGRELTIGAGAESAAFGSTDPVRKAVAESTPPIPPPKASATRTARLGKYRRRCVLLAGSR